MMHGSKFTLPFRNLLRRPGRTAIILSGICAGVVAILLAGGFIEWIFWAMRESTILYRTGHIQVVRPGYLDHGSADPFSYLLPEHSGELEAIERNPEIKAVSPKLFFSGLISRGESTVSFIGEGVDPEREEAFDPQASIRKGERLAAARPNGIILGVGLAQTLGVVPGDRVVLLANTAAGGFNGVEADVSGLFTTSNKEFDDVVIRTPLPMARQLLRVSGSHAWVILLKGTLHEQSHTSAAIETLRKSSIGGGVAFEFVPWYSLADFYKKSVSLLSRQMDVVRIIIAVIIILGISNVLIMSVLDRTSEIGTLKALGLRCRDILRLFLMESAILGLLGGLLGVGVGCALGEALSFVGIPMPPAPGMDIGYTAKILISWQLVAGSWLLAFSTTLVAGIYPAWKASRLEIVDALRHGR